MRREHGKNCSPCTWVQPLHWKDSEVDSNEADYRKSEICGRGLGTALARRCGHFAGRVPSLPVAIRYAGVIDVPGALLRPRARTLYHCCPRKGGVQQWPRCDHRFHANEAPPESLFAEVPCARTILRRTKYEPGSTLTPGGHAVFFMRRPRSPIQLGDVSFLATL